MSMSAKAAPTTAETISEDGWIKANVAQIAILAQNKDIVRVPSTAAHAALMHTRLATAHCHARPASTKPA